MEAVWSRFQPITHQIQAFLASGVLGEICAVRSELGINWRGADSHRMINPDLAGGALLDVGPYSWTWLALLLLPRANIGETEPLPLLPVAASMLKHKSTGVDISTVATIQFARADGTPIHGTMHAAFNAQNSKTYSVLVQCEKGWLGVHWLPQRPAWFEYKAWDSAEAYEDWMEKPCAKEERVEVATPEGMMGFAFEADEVARCVRDGETESERMPVRESVLMLAVSAHSAVSCLDGTVLMPSLVGWCRCLTRSGGRAGCASRTRSRPSTWASRDESCVSFLLCKCFILCFQWSDKPDETRPAGRGADGWYWEGGWEGGPSGRAAAVPLLRARARAALDVTTQPCQRPPSSSSTSTLLNQTPRKPTRPDDSVFSARIGRTHFVPL